VQINNTTVIHKIPFSHYVTSEECLAFRSAFQVSFITLRVNFIIYLSRRGQQCEAVRREYPSEICERAMQRMGAKILKTEDLIPILRIRALLNLNCISGRN
jgi:hypothetical protein